MEISRLKKTSIDYTLCDVDDRTLLCIEFDGLQEGINAGAHYHSTVVPGDIWRQEITDLKLKVAHGSMFPFFVVSPSYFKDDLTTDTKLMIVDGIIGEVLAIRARTKIFEGGFHPEEVGWTQDEFNALPEWDQDEVVRDWALGIEVAADVENNPLVRKRWELMMDLDIKSYGHKPLYYPAVDDLDHSPDIHSLKHRIEQIDKAILNGSETTLYTDDFGEVKAKAWIANFKTPYFSGIGLLDDISTIMAMEKLKKLRSKAVPGH